jgi:uncharacterized protein with FMN-binding domain
MKNLLPAVCILAVASTIVAFMVGFATGRAVEERNSRSLAYEEYQIGYKAGVVDGFAQCYKGTVKLP